MNLSSERFDRRQRVNNLIANLQSRRKPRIAEPIMSDHSPFIGIGDGTLLQFRHRDKSRLQTRPHPLKIIIREIHPAQVQSEPEGWDRRIILLKPQPEFFFGFAHSGRKIAEPPPTAQTIYI